MHSFSHFIVSSKRKRNITHTSTNSCSRKVIFYPFCSFKKIYRIIIVLRNSCCYRKNIWIKNNVLRRKFHLIHQDIIRSFTNLNSSFVVIGLSIFIKSHNYSCGTIHFNFFGLLNKLFFSFFKTNRVYNSFSLNTFKSSFNDFPFTRINHHRNSCNVWFRCN